MLVDPLSIEGFIFILYFIYLILTSYFIKLIYNYISETIEEYSSILRAFKGNRVDV